MKERNDTPNPAAARVRAGGDLEGGGRMPKVLSAQKIQPFGRNAGPELYRGVLAAMHPSSPSFLHGGRNERASSTVLRTILGGISPASRMQLETNAPVKEKWECEPLLAGPSGKDFSSYALQSLTGASGHQSPSIFNVASNL